MALTTSRRKLLQGAGAGLVIAIVLPARAFGQLRRLDPSEFPKLPATPNAFLRIAPDNTVTVIVKHIEMGQGALTGAATLAAEELDADWGQMRAENAPANAALYFNLNMGMQGSGGSSGMFNSYYQMRKAGAAARAMLVAAAAQRWGVPADQITVERGIIAHAASANRSGFGAFADAAARMPFPANPALKDPADFRLIGADLQRIDSTAKSTGTATFTIDVVRPNMVHSAILHPPAFGAVALRVDAAATKAIPGVLAVHQLPQGVVVFAANRFAAQRGVAALEVEWDHAKVDCRSCDDMYRTYAQAVQSPGANAESRGLGAGALAATARQVEAEYRFPFLAHAPMEPMGAVVELGADNADVWMASQLVTPDHHILSEVLGLPLEQVRLHVMSAGGSFGRLGTPDGEFAREAACVARAWGKGSVKHLWTRENDIRGGRYRPLVVHRLRGGLDASGNITTWDQVIAAQSFMQGTPLGGGVKNGIDSAAIEGARGMAYNIPNFHVGLHLMPNGVPANFFRSVGHSHTAFAVECFMDELLALGNRDPVKGRLALHKPANARLSAVLERVADMAKWSGAKGQSERAYGVAAVFAFRSYVAQIAEISRGDDGLPRVHKVWCAVDCGVAVNPDVVRAQIEGGIGFALGAAMYGEINIDANGAPVKGNFDHYRVLRMSEMPAVEVSIMKSAMDPTGIGETGCVPLPPAVANAWRALTGKSIRNLPFAKGALA